MPLVRRGLEESSTSDDTVVDAEFEEVDGDAAAGDKK